MRRSDDTLWTRLVETLEDEIAALGRLVRLSHRQKNYLLRQDSRRVKWNVENMDVCIDRSMGLYERRAQVQRELGVREPGRKGLKLVAAAADTPWRERVQALEAALAQVMELLGRKNLQNYQLSRFSLDLVGEEMRLLLGASDSSGATYDAEGTTGEPAPSGAVDGRA